LAGCLAEGFPLSVLIFSAAFLLSDTPIGTGHPV
jgi:hypothetical protein